MNVEIRTGDWFLIDSEKTGPKIVKFFMTAPTVWQHLWRKIRGTQEKVLYYHVGMFLSQDEIVEQQAKVIRKPSNKILNSSNRLMIIRLKGLPESVRTALYNFSLLDEGKGYDVLNCFGKFLTWLTGIPLFARYVEWPKAEICINRVAYWLRYVGETFGAKKHSELTTHRMYKYIKAHPEKFEIVYEGIPRND